MRNDQGRQTPRQIPSIVEQNVEHWRQRDAMTRPVL
jgi:hypothetical protein